MPAALGVSLVVGLIALVLMAPVFIALIASHFDFAAASAAASAPARMPQLRGSTLLDWEENLPAVPDDVRRANAAHVGHRLVERLGGDGPAWEA